jgi:hypothetical protein
VCVSIEHNKRKCKEVRRIRIMENSRIIEMVPLGKTLHYTVNLLGLSRKPEAGQKLSIKIA